MQSNRLICFGLMAVGLLTACKKTSVQELGFDATGTYTMSTVPSAGPVRMFTQAGEVQNASLVRAFSIRHYGILLYSPGVVSPFQTAELVFTSTSEASLNTTALMNGSGLSRSSVAVDVTSQTNANLLLTSKMSGSSLFMPVNPDRCINILRDIRGFPPVYTCTALPPSSGSNTRCDYKPVYVLKLKGKDASLAAMSFIFVASANGQSCTLGWRNEFNVLNPTLPRRLTVGDTLVVQEAEFPLVRK